MLQEYFYKFGDNSATNKYSISKKKSKSNAMAGIRKKYMYKNIYINIYCNIAKKSRMAQWIIAQFRVLMFPLPIYLQ